jgi:hypothetical protein
VAKASALKFQFPPEAIEELKAFAIGSRPDRGGVASEGDRDREVIGRVSRLRSPWPEHVSQSDPHTQQRRPGSRPSRRPAHCHWVIAPAVSDRLTGPGTPLRRLLAADSATQLTWLTALLTPVFLGPNQGRRDPQCVPRRPRGCGTYRSVCLRPKRPSRLLE